MDIRRFIRRNIYDVMAFTGLLLLYIEALASALDIQILSPLGRAVSILCLLAYVMYRGEINKRRKAMAKKNARMNREKLIQEQFEKDYAQFRLDRMKREYES